MNKAPAQTSMAPHCISGNEELCMMQKLTLVDLFVDRCSSALFSKQDSWQITFRVIWFAVSPQHFVAITEENWIQTNSHVEIQVKFVDTNKPYDYQWRNKMPWINHFSLFVPWSLQWYFYWCCEPSAVRCSSPPVEGLISKNVQHQCRYHCIVFKCTEL